MSVCVCVCLPVVSTLYVRPTIDQGEGASRTLYRRLLCGRVSVSPSHSLTHSSTHFSCRLLCCEGLHQVGRNGHSLQRNASEPFHLFKGHGCMLEDRPGPHTREECVCGGGDRGSCLAGREGGRVGEHSCVCLLTCIHPSIHPLTIRHTHAHTETLAAIRQAQNASSRTHCCSHASQPASQPFSAYLSVFIFVCLWSYTSQVSLSASLSVCLFLFVRGTAASDIAGTINMSVMMVANTATPGLSTNLFV